MADHERPVDGVPRVIEKTLWEDDRHMNRRFHGVFSLLLVFGALIIGLVSVFHESVAMGVVYLVIILVSLPTIVYAFCSKCTCRLDSCGHVLPGPLTRWLPQRKQGDYTRLDFAGLLVPFLVLAAFPQWWLWKSMVLFAVFWVLFLLGLVEIRRCVCPDCTNKRCPLCTRPVG